MMGKSTLLSVILVAGLVGLTDGPAWARGRGGIGRMGSTQGTVSACRQPGSWQRNYQGTRTGPRGNTSQVDRTSNFNRTGRNTYSKSGQQTITGPNGHTRTAEAQGCGTVNRTENGFAKSYQGTITTDRGKTFDVDRSGEVTKNGDGTRTKETTSTYTNQQGQSRTVDHTTTGSKTGDGGATLDRQSTVSDGQGETLGTWNRQGQAQWQYVDGRWVKVYSGQSVNP